MTHGPLFRLRVRLSVAHELRQWHGLSFVDSIALAKNIDDELIQVSITQANATAAVEAIGDGKILGKIVDFLKSDLGRSIIKILVGLLLV